MSLTEQAVQRSIKEMIHRSEWYRSANIQLLDDMYSGGKDATGHLTRFPGEKAEWWTHRRATAANPPYFSMLTDFIRDSSLGQPPQITLEETAYQQRLDEVFVENDWDNLHSAVGLGTVLHGGGWVRVGPDPLDPMPRLVRVHAGNMRMWTDPMTGRMVRAVEMIGIDTGQSDRSAEGEHEFWSWTDETVERFNSDGDIIESRPNPYRLIPYVYFPGKHDPNSDEGTSYVHDAAYLQVELMQSKSYFQRIVLMHSGSTLVTKGYSASDIELGVTGHLAIEDPQGDAYYLTPSSKIIEFRDVLDWMVETMYRTHRVPTSIVTGTVMESGIALEIKWRPMTQQAQAIRTRVTPAYETLAHVIAVVDRVETRTGSGMATASVAFRSDILPTDTRSERQEDRADWEAGLMSDDEYLKKWGPERVRDDDQARAEYIEELNTQRQSKTDRENSAGLSGFAGLGFGDPFAPPPGGGLVLP